MHFSGELIGTRSPSQARFAGTPRKYARKKSFSVASQPGSGVAAANDEIARAVLGKPGSFRELLARQQQMDVTLKRCWSTRLRPAKFGSPSTCQPSASSAIPRAPALAAQPTGGVIGCLSRSLDMLRRVDEITAATCTRLQ